MTHGTLAPEDWQNIVTVRPGPVPHVWRNGAEFCNVPLSHRAAINLIGSLTAAMQVTLPDENLQFDEYLAKRDNERDLFEPERDA